MSATWQEIKLLAADLHRAQSVTSRSNLLNERDCVQLIQQLSASDVIQVVHTEDGRAIVTRKYLLTEIQHEVIHRGGSVSLNDLQFHLGVSAMVVKHYVDKLVRDDEQLSLVHGQLHTTDYLYHILDEIIELCEEKEQVQLSELSSVYNFPVSYLLKLITTSSKHRMLLLDNTVVYSRQYISQCNARVRGYLLATVLPISLPVLSKTINVSESLLVQLIDKLVLDKRLVGQITAAKTCYVPKVFESIQKKLIVDFYSQNNYVDFQFARKLGVSNIKQYLSNCLDRCVFASNCCLHESLIDHLSVVIDDCVSQESWTDLILSFPSVVIGADIETLCAESMKRHPSAKLVSESVFVSGACYDKCCHHFDSVITQKAQEVVVNSPELVLQLIEAKQQSGSLSRIKSRSNSCQSRSMVSSANNSSCPNSPLIGRSVKSKCVSKCKNVHNRNSQSPAYSEPNQLKNLPFVSIVDIETELRSFFASHAVDDFLSELAVELFQPLKKLLHETIMQISVQSLDQKSSAKCDVRYSQMQESIVYSFYAIRMLERGAAYFTGELRHNLLRNIMQDKGQHIVNFICAWKSNKPFCDFYDVAEREAFILQTKPNKLRDALWDLHVSSKANNWSSSKDNLDEFYSSLDSLASVLDFTLSRCVDRRRERHICQEIMRELQNNLTVNCDQLSSYQRLSQCCSLIVYSRLNCPIVSVSNDSLSLLVSALHDLLSPEEYNVIRKYYDFIEKDDVLPDDLNSAQNDAIRLALKCKMSMRSISRDRR